MMREAMAAAAARFQAGVPAGQLASSAAILQEELDLFPQWCVQREHGIHGARRSRSSGRACARCWCRRPWRSRWWPCTATGCPAT
jgi:aminoglycoside/choline kinase family phosphotransferase